MALYPVSNPYPGNTPLQEARADAVLAAAGAWDASPTELWCVGWHYATFYLTYDPDNGATAPAVDFKVEVSPYSTDAEAPTGANAWTQQGLYEAGTLAAGSDVQSLEQREYVTYTYQGTPATPDPDESIPYGALLNGGAQRIRVSCRESGDTANPGNVQVEVLFAM